MLLYVVHVHTLTHARTHAWISGAQPVPVRGSLVSVHVGLRACQPRWTLLPMLPHHAYPSSSKHAFNYDFLFQWHKFVRIYYICKHITIHNIVHYTYAGWFWCVYAYLYAQPFFIHQLIRICQHKNSVLWHLYALPYDYKRIYSVRKLLRKSENFDYTMLPANRLNHT